MVSLLEFTSKLIEHLAWPIAVIILAIHFKDNFSELINNLKRFKYGSLEAEFRELLDSPEAKARASDQVQDMDTVRAIAEISPNAAIPYAWSEFEKVVINFISHRQGFKDEGIGPRIGPNIQILLEEGVISRSDADLANRLRRLRNEITHHIHSKEQITKQSAIEYARNIDYLIQTLTAKHNAN